MHTTKHHSALLLLTALSLGCGSGVSGVAPDLPGVGTANLATPHVSSSEAPASEIDLWEGRELIEAPEPKPPAAMSLPAVKRFTLKNGLEVIAVHDDSVPVTSMQLAVKAGKRHSERSKVGLAEFTAQAMTRGTKRRNAARIAQEIEAIGGSFQASASYEATLFSCKSLSKDIKTCLTILPDVMTSPRFPESEIDIIRRNLHASVRQRLDDAGQLASAHFQSALWGEGHPRGQIMSARTIDGIGRKDLVDWHKRWMRPNNAILAISGNFQEGQLQAQLERSFGRWRTAELPKTPEVALPKLRGMKIRLVDKPGQTQSHIRIGHYGLAHSDPNFYAAMVFNYTLGGGQFSSRLMKVVRSAEGKAYTASSSFDRNQEVGAFVAATFTRSAETVATIKLMMKVVAGMGKEGPNADELSAAITNIAGSYATRFETAGDIASALLAAELHGFGHEYVSQYPLKIAGVTQANAAAAAARVLDPVNFHLVVVGDAKIVGPQLEAAGWAYESVSHTDPVSNWERSGDEQAAQTANDPAARAAAAKILDAALAAKGGAKRLARLKSFHWRGDAVLNLPTGPMKAEVEKRFARPDKLRLDMSIGGGKIKIATVLDGKSGWAQEEGPKGKQVRPFSAPELAALGSQLWRDSELVLLRHRDAGAVLTPLGERRLEGTKVIAIEVANAAGNGKVTLLVDAKSKLLIGMDYTDQGMATSERFADYKKVDGVQVAFTRSTKSEQVNMSLSVKSAEFDKATPAGIFTQPASSDK